MGKGCAEVTSDAPTSQRPADVDDTSGSVAAVGTADRRFWTRPSRLRAAALLALIVAPASSLGVAGCGAIVPGATFRAHPDVADRADLLGPFDGVVLDGDTGQPVPGALILGSWSFRRGLGVTGPSGSRTFETVTRSDGRYVIPRLESPPGGLTQVIDGFQLVIYKAGYVAYRSDRRFMPAAPRLDFTQHLNVARMERWRPELSHAAHLAYLGSGGAGPIRVASRWEAQAASAELDQPGLPGTAVGRPVPRPQRTLDVGGVLSIPEIRQETGYRGDFDVARLADQPTTPTYDSLHFKARGQDERYDLAIRAWYLPPDDLEAQFQALLDRLPQARRVNRLADSSLVAQEGPILAVAFLARRAGFVLSMTCGQRLCRDHRVLEGLARRVLVNLGAAQRSVEPAPSKSAPEPAPAPTPEPAPFQLKPPEPRLTPPARSPAGTP
jgi:hypothetical protein